MPNEKKGWNEDEETIINFSARVQAAKAANEATPPPPEDDLGLGAREPAPAAGETASAGLVFADPAPAAPQEPLIPPDAATAGSNPPLVQGPSIPVQPQPAPPPPVAFQTDPAQPTPIPTAAAPTPPPLPSVPPLPPPTREVAIDPPTRMDVPDLAEAAAKPEIPLVPEANIDAPTQNEVTILDSTPPPQEKQEQVVHESGEVVVTYPDPGTETLDAVAFLVIMKTPSVRLHQMFRLDKEKMDIGRAFDTPIFLDDKTVSLRHAAIRYEMVGNRPEFVLYDLAALNGTYLNGAQVYRATLKDGDRISVGLTELVFKRV